ncbi:Zn(II)2Cys6 transcription factor [Aspergillus stella-maris]|uniref:Zn(II)2Cys6 transcription factor n=1 Tax=Aspergillus stella-maris TaxID=1810926 RepID=UPI003CCDC4B3
MESQSTLPASICQPPLRRRRKRAQVARACASCRIRHIKCDNQTPCSHCTQAGIDCSNSGASTSFTLSEAHCEITALRQRIGELQAELEGRPHQHNDHSTPISGSAGSEMHPASSADTTKTYWGGVYFRPARSANSLWLGPSSLYSYVHRLSGFLSLNFHQEHPANQLLPDSASDDKLLDRPVTSLDVRQLLSSAGDSSSAKSLYLTPIQEDYFINYFWQTYHVSLFPILDETQFKKHYGSLWDAGNQTRKASALVDIVVAMCMQYHISTLPLASQGVLVDGKDALVAGRWHYWRGQTLLTYELESPSIATLQCHLLCSVYLCGGSFHNMLDSAVAQAVRTAYILGLHIDPPPSMPEPDRELHRRLWWAVYQMDSRSGMKLGRPFRLSDSYAMPDLPSDSFEAAAMSGSAFVPIGENSTWLSFNLAAYTSFYNTKFNFQTGQDIWDDLESLNTGAEVLTRHTARLQDWCDTVPQSLLLPRQNNGKPFSTSGPPLSLEQFVPPWLQRQRVLLELTYHHWCTNLYRPMVSFKNRPQPGTGHLVEVLAMRSAEHAIALSKITHQVMQETNLLDGWHEAFYCQWNAAVTLVGIFMIYPHSSLAVEIRDAITSAIGVFENFGAKFAIAGDAARIVRGLLDKADFLVSGPHAFPPPEGNDNTIDKVNAFVWDDFDTFNAGNAVNGVQNSGGNYSNTGYDLLDLAGDIDFWNSVDMLWPDANSMSV